MLNGTEGNDDLKRPSSCKKVEGHDLTKNSGGDVVGFLKFPLEKVLHYAFLYSIFGINCCC